MFGGAASRRRPAVMQRGVTQRRHRPDYVLLVLSAILLVVGLVVIYSISPGLAAQRNVSENYYAVKQLIAIGLGLLTFAAMATIPYDLWRKLQKPLIVAAVVATLIALALPVSEQYPAHRWIRFGGLSFQSVELVKFAVIFVFAAFLTERIKRQEVFDKEKALKPIGIALVVMAFLIAGLQSDLGSTGVVIAIMGLMWFVAGLPFRYILIGLAGIAVVFLMAIATSDYRRDRMLTFLQPERDCSAAGYQACQALIAVGSGGLFGKGIGQSVQAYGYLPEAANDSIFAILAEKFGFVGVTALLCVFWAFFTRIKNIMERAPDDFSRLVVAGILAWLSTQAIINIGAMIGLLPLKGITLPFISYGGTSIIFVTGAIGLVYNISRYTTYGVNEGIPESRLPQQSNRRYSVVTPNGR
jgi:cell division protein FtsW